jgi:type III secretion system (T3SS) SseB-like protein
LIGTAEDKEPIPCKFLPFAAFRRLVGDEIRRYRAWVRITSGNVSGSKGDTGAADHAVTAALDAWARGTGGEHEALTALAAARLVVPVVAMLSERNENGTEKETEMALPTLVGKDGRKAVIAFTGTETLMRWNADARPVPFPAGRVWEYAVAEGNAVVVDVAGPVPLVVEGARLAALAAGERPPLPYEDPDVHAEIAAVTDRFTVEPGPSGSDFLVTLRIADASAARRAAEEITARVRAGGRFRRGVGFRTSLSTERIMPSRQSHPYPLGDTGCSRNRLGLRVAIWFTPCFGG